MCSSDLIEAFLEHQTWRKRSGNGKQHTKRTRPVADTEQYGFGFYGITLGPIVMVIGFIVEFFAIWAKDKSAE